MFCLGLRRVRRPAKLTPAAEILAPREAVEEVVILNDIFLQHFALLSRQWYCLTLIISSDRYHRHGIWLANRLEMMPIWWVSFEKTVNIFEWISGWLNPADVASKKDSPLPDAFVLTLATAELQIDLDGCQFSDRYKPYDWTLPQKKGDMWIVWASSCWPGYVRKYILFSVNAVSYILDCRWHFLIFFNRDCELNLEHVINQGSNLL